MSGKALLLQELISAGNGILYSVSVPVLSTFLSARQAGSRASLLFCLSKQEGGTSPTEKKEVI